MKTFEDFVRILSGYVRRIRLDQDTRDSVRERLAAYADLHALTGKLPAAPRLSFFQPWNLRVLQGGFAVLLVMVSMGGMAYASNDALPGDRLYAVKTGIVEPLESALLSDARSKATWNAILAERRLIEAASLAAAGRLDEPVRIELEERFAYHAERSNSAAEEVRAKGDVAIALAIHSDLEARLSAHEDLFSYIASDETRPEAVKLLARIAEKRAVVAQERLQAETAVVGRSLAYGERQIEVAEKTTEEVARVAKANGIEAGSIDARITAAREALSSARASSAKGEGGVAYVATQVAARLTHEASILAKNRGILALAPSPSATSASEPAAAFRAAKEPQRNAKEPTDTVILLSVPQDDAEDAATTTEETKKDDAKEPKKSSRTETRSQDSQDDERSTKDNSSSSSSSSDPSSSGSTGSGPVRDLVKKVLSPLGR